MAMVYVCMCVIMIPYGVCCPEREVVTWTKHTLLKPLNRQGGEAALKALLAAHREAEAIDQEVKAKKELEPG